MDEKQTFADLLDLYLDEYLPQKAPGTQRQYHQVLRCARAQFGAMTLEDITPTRLRAWRDEIKRRLAPATVRTWLDIVSAPLTVAVDDLEWLSRNPMKKVPRPAAPEERVRYLSDSERTALLAACKASSQAALYPMVLIALTTGARKNEIRKLRYMDIDFDRGLLRLARTKNGTGRPVPVPQVTLDTLHAWANAQPIREDLCWLFPAQRSQGPAQIGRAWDIARRRAGLVDFHFHDLRHTAVSYLLMSGADIREVAEILGHKSLRMTMKYIHLALPHTRGVVERMAQQFLSEDEGGRGSR
jgi:integrase